MKTTLTVLLNNKKMEERRIKSKKRRIATVFLILSLLIITNFISKSPGDAAGKGEENVVIVRKGDTLWKIAENHATARIDLREFVYHIKQANNMDTSVIQPGQRIIIPD